LASLPDRVLLQQHYYRQVRPLMSISVSGRRA
jgi:hypothetical protein